MVDKIVTLRLAVDARDGIEAAKRFESQVEASSKGAANSLKAAEDGFSGTNRAARNLADDASSSAPRYDRLAASLRQIASTSEALRARVEGLSTGFAGLARSSEGGLRQLDAAARSQARSLDELAAASGRTRVGLASVGASSLEAAGALDGVGVASVRSLGEGLAEVNLLKAGLVGVAEEAGVAASSIASVSEAAAVSSSAPVAGSAVVGSAGAASSVGSVAAAASAAAAAKSAAELEAGVAAARVEMGRFASSSSTANSFIGSMDEKTYKWAAHISACVDREKELGRPVEEWKQRVQTVAKAWSDVQGQINKIEALQGKEKVPDDLRVNERLAMRATSIESTKVDAIFAERQEALALDDLEAGLLRVQKGETGAASAASGFAGALGSILAFVAPMAIVGFFAKCAEIAGQAELAQHQLRSSLELTGQAAGSTVLALTKAARELSQASMSSETDVARMEAQLVNLGIAAKDVPRAAQAAIDVAAALGREPAEVARTVGAMIESGSTRPLKQLGIAIEDLKFKAGDADKVLGALEEKFGGRAAAEMGTYEGAVNRLGKSFKGVMKDLGEAIEANLKGKIEESITLLGKLRVLIYDARVGGAINAADKAMGGASIWGGIDVKRFQATNDALLETFKYASETGRLQNTFDDFFAALDAGTLRNEKAMRTWAEHTLFYMKERDAEAADPRNKPLLEQIDGERKAILDAAGSVVDLQRQLDVVDQARAKGMIHDREYLALQRQIGQEAAKLAKSTDVSGRLAELAARFGQEGGGAAKQAAASPYDRLLDDVARLADSREMILVAGRYLDDLHAKFGAGKVSADSYADGLTAATRAIESNGKALGWAAEKINAVVKAHGGLLDEKPFEFKIVKQIVDGSKDLDQVYKEFAKVQELFGAGQLSQIQYGEALKVLLDEATKMTRGLGQAIREELVDAAWDVAKDGVKSLIDEIEAETAKRAGELAGERGGEWDVYKDDARRNAARGQVSSSDQMDVTGRYGENLAKAKSAFPQLPDAQQQRIAVDATNNQTKALTQFSVASKAAAAAAGQLAASFVKMALTGKISGKAVREAIGDMMADVATQMFTLSLEYLALGAMASTIWGAAILGPPAPYFAAAGVSAGAGGVALVAAKLLGTSEASVTDSGSASAGSSSTGTPISQNPQTRALQISVSFDHAGFIQDRDGLIRDLNAAFNKADLEGSMPSSATA